MQRAFPLIILFLLAISPTSNSAESALNEEQQARLSYFVAIGGSPVLIEGFQNEAMKILEEQIKHETRQDGHSRARMSILSYLAHYSGRLEKSVAAAVTGVALDGLQSKDPRERSGAVDMVSQAGGAALLDHIRPLIEDHDEGVRIKAIKCYCDDGEARRIAELERLLENRKRGLPATEAESDRTLKYGREALASQKARAQANAKADPVKAPPAPDPRFECILAADRETYRVGEVPRLTYRILNKSGEDVLLIGFLDGASRRIGSPRCQLHILDSEGKPVTARISRCGFVNPRRATDFVLVPAGQTFGQFGQFVDMGSFPICTPGEFTFRFYYSTLDPAPDGLGGQIRREIGDEPEVRRLYERVPKVELMSNDVKIRFTEAPK